MLFEFRLNLNLLKALIYIVYILFLFCSFFMNLINNLILYKHHFLTIKKKKSEELSR